MGNSWVISLLLPLVTSSFTVLSFSNQCPDVPRKLSLSIKTGWDKNSVIRKDAAGKCKSPASCCFDIPEGKTNKEVGQMIVDQYKRLKCMQMGYQFADPRLINDLENMVIEIVINTAVCIEQPFNLSDCSDVDDDTTSLDYNIVYETSTNLQRLLEKLYVSTVD